jgi:hypothetical protein
MKGQNMQHIPREYPTIGEKRFKERSGERYLADGVTIRCQAVAKHRLRAAREESGDFTSPAEKWWPELQCTRGAAPGQYVCKFHGGLSPRTVPRTILDVLPEVLADKFQTIQNNPDYIDRKEEIILFKAMIWEALEQLDQEGGSQEAWDMVQGAYDALSTGSIISAKALLFKALESTNRSKELRREIRANANVLADLTTTQTKTAKELRLMATHEQVAGMLAEVQNAFFDAIDRVKLDAETRTRLGTLFLGRLVRFNKLGTTAIPDELSSGTEQTD